MAIPAKMLMGFDYYGAGNAGDDLMVGGFLRALELLGFDRPLELFSFYYEDPASQRRRFPQIQWIDKRQGHWINNPALRGVDCWAGVGDTPIQMTSGPWFFDALRADVPHVGRFPIRRLINVGAESEVLSHEMSLAHLLQTFERITTRDGMSLGVYRALGAPEGRCRAGADLAHLFLRDFAAAAAPAREFDLGVVIAGDTLSDADIETVGEFLLQAPAKVAFIANETRPKATMERGIYDRLVKRHGPRMLAAAQLLVPDYAQGSMADLLEPIAKCRTILSSRYHAALAAAWLGCKVGVIARSSKLQAIAEELRVPVLAPPLAGDALRQLADRATPVPRQLLADLAGKAVEGVSFALAN
jgi:polysaccharide pyruvyl transferase WcaK-like protein